MTDENITKIAADTNFIFSIYFWAAKSKLNNLWKLANVFIFDSIRFEYLLTHLISALNVKILLNEVVINHKSWDERYQFSTYEHLVCIGHSII